MFLGDAVPAIEEQAAINAASQMALEPFHLALDHGASLPGQARLGGWAAAHRPNPCSIAGAIGLKPPVLPDGQVLKMGKGPRPPEHTGCRCTTIPIIKSWQELGIDLEEMPESTRASMNGQVPESLRYGDWLRKQGAGFQDEVLGKGRAELFRGGLPIDRFTDRAGNELTLKQLRAAEPISFRTLSSGQGIDEGVGGAFRGDLGFDEKNVAMRDTVFARGNETGHEWMGAVDEKSGKVWDVWTDKSKIAVRLSDDLVRHMEEFGGSSLRIHHNHPNNSTLSDADMNSALQWKCEIVAHTPTGSTYAAKVLDSLSFRSAYKQAGDLVDAARRRLPKKDRLLEEMAARYEGHLVNMVLSRAGVIRYNFSIGSVPYANYSKVEAAFEALAERLAKKVKL